MNVSFSTAALPCGTLLAVATKRSHVSCWIAGLASTTRTFEAQRLYTKQPRMDNSKSRSFSLIEVPLLMFLTLYVSRLSGNTFNHQALEVYPAAETPVSSLVPSVSVGNTLLRMAQIRLSRRPIRYRDVSTFHDVWVKATLSTEQREIKPLSASIGYLN